jgi:5,10-methylenetetrahydromethanopterin reductase
MSRPAFGLNRHDWSTPTAFAADVARAEALGWDWAFMPVNPLSIWDPYVMLALAARATTRIGLGTLLENAVLDNPASIANGIASVDAVAGGSRTMLGLGVGDTAVRFQNRQPAKVAELEAVATLVRRYLAGGEVDLGAPQPAVLRSARSVPVWIAAGGPRTLRMAGAAADGVFLRVGRHPDNLRHAVTQVHEGAAQAGRDPEGIGIGLIFHTVVSDDAGEIHATARVMAAGFYEYSPRLFDIPGLPWDGPHPDELKAELGIGDFHHAPDPVAAGRRLDFLGDEVADAFALFGSAADIAAQVDAVLGLGFRVDVIVTHPVPTPVPHEPVRRRVPDALAGADYTEWFVGEVLPMVTA